MPLGTSCWHIQWVVAKFTTSMTTEQNINVVVVTLPQSGNSNDVVTISVEIDSDSETEEICEQIDLSTPTKQSTSREFQQIVAAAVQDFGSGKQWSRRIIFPAIVQKSTMSTKPKTITAVITPSEKEFEVQALVGRRVDEVRNKLQYLVQWKGYSEKYNSWECIDDLFCDQLIEEFERTRGGDQSAAATLTVAGQLSRTDKVIQYLDTPYFLVPYGQGQFNKYCIVGPDANGTQMRCKHCRHPKTSHHLGHAAKVVVALNEANGEFAHFAVHKFLPNFGKNLHFLLADNINAATDEAEYLESITALSWKSISLDLDKTVTECLGDTMYHHKLKTKERFEPPKEDIPAYGKCLNDQMVACSYTAPECAFTHSKLYTEMGVFAAKVFVVRCTNNNAACTIHYDGQLDGVFNFTGMCCIIFIRVRKRTLIAIFVNIITGNILVSYTLMMDFLFTMLSGNGITFSGYAKKIALKYQYTYDCLIPFMSIPTWISCFFSWSLLVEAGTQFSFSCILCNQYPTWLGFDGVSLACPKRHIQWTTVDQIPNLSDPLKTPHNVVKKGDRMMLATKTTRSLLYAFLYDECNAEKFSQLLSGLQADRITEPSFVNNGIGTLLKHLYETELILSGKRQKVSNYSFYGIWKPLLSVFCSADALSFFIHPTLVPALAHYLSTNILLDSTILLLNTRCPVIGSICAVFNNQGIPKYAQQMFQAMLRRCCIAYPFAFQVTNNQYQLIVRPQLEEIQNTVDVPTTLLSNHHYSQGVEHLHISRLSNAIARVIEKRYIKIPDSSFTLSGVFWPSWPKVRQFHRYVGYNDVPDKNTDKNAWADIEEDMLTSDTVCKKADTRAYINKDLIAGIFVGCCIHTVCYGFHLMLAPEGRKDVFKVLYERFPSEVLDHVNVIFDAACQAGEYCIKREPELFAFTNFFVDRFHGVTHTCNNFWKLASYPGLVELISSSNESLNDFLQQFHSQAAYMKQATLMQFVKFLTGVCNWLLSKKHKNDIQIFNAKE
jgi:hypothetical protein